MNHSARFSILQKSAFFAATLLITCNAQAVSSSCHALLNRHAGSGFEVPAMMMEEPLYSDDLAIAQSNKERVLDQFMAGQELLVNQELHKKATAAIARIQKLDKSNDLLRAQNGVFETEEATARKMRTVTFEVFVLLDDLQSIQVHFANLMAATERAAIRFQASEAIINSYRDLLAGGKIDPDSAQKLIETETVDLNLARREFMDYSEKTISVYYALEIMKESGELVDPTSTNGARTEKRAISGKRLETKIQEPMYGLESMSLAMPAMPTYKKPAQQHNAEEIRKRAQQIDENFAKVMATQPVQEIVKRAEDIAHKHIGRPSYKALVDLQERLSKDPNSTTELVARKERLNRQERLLRWKMRLMGPQLSENISTWLGSVNGKYRKSVEPIARLARMQYDSAMRRRHLPKVLKILSLENPKTQLDELIDGSAPNAYAGKGELIVTFIRFSRSRENWNLIKKVLEESEHSYDKKLLAEFNRYEDEAIHRGPLPLIGPASDPMGSAISSGVGAGVVGLTGGGATWLAEKAWLEAQSLYSSENMHSLLHLVHLTSQ